MGHLQLRGRLGDCDLGLSVLPPHVPLAVVRTEGRMDVGAAVRGCRSARTQCFAARSHAAFLHGPFPLPRKFLLLSCPLHTQHATLQPRQTLLICPGPFRVTVSSSLLLDIISLSFSDARPCWRGACSVLGLSVPTCRTVLSHSCHYPHKAN